MDERELIQGIFDMCKFTEFVWCDKPQWFRGKTSNKSIDIIVYVDWEGENLVCRADGLTPTQADKLKSLLGGIHNSYNWRLDISLGDPDLTRKFADAVNGVTFNVVTRLGYRG
jgi:hypothetical protein